MAKQKKEFNYNDPFPKRLRALIKQKGITFDTLAEELGTTRQTVSNWQAGSTIPDAISLRWMACYFSVTTDYLLGVTDSPTIKKDTRAAAELTGLSTGAIERLSYKADMNDWIGKPAQWREADKEILSDMIESDVLRKIVLNVEKFRENLKVDAERENIEEFGEVIETPTVKGSKIAKYDAQEQLMLYFVNERQRVIDSVKAGDSNGTGNKKGK